MFVSADYFRAIGVTLVRGPGFDEKRDDAFTAEPVVILGYRLLAEPAGLRSGHRREDADLGRHAACRGRYRT